MRKVLFPNGSIVFVVAIAGVWCLPAEAEMREPGSITVLAELVERYADGAVTNALAASAGQLEGADGDSGPAIFLHPAGADDAVLSFSEIPVPGMSEGQRCIFYFQVGFRPGFDWNATPNTPNGVRFSVFIEGECVFEEEVAESGWKPRCVDLTPWAGRSISIELHTNAIAGNSSYDWALWGDPLILDLWSAPELSTLPAEARGLALVEVVCEQSARVVLRNGSRPVTAALEPGTQLFPLAFDAFQAPAMDVETGVAAIANVYAGVYLPELEVVATELSSPLVTAGKPFSIIQRVRNTGRGAHTRRVLWTLRADNGRDVAELGAGATEALPVDRLLPGEETTLAWRGLVAQSPGEWQLEAGAKLRVHVFPEERIPPHPRTEEPVVIVERNGDIRAVVANAWSRLALVVDETGAAYAMADTWDGAGWRRVASLYPLCRLMLRHADGSLEELRLQISNIHPLRSTWLCIYGIGESETGLSWPILLMAYAEADSARIHLEVETIAPEDAGIAAFSLPQVLAGDRAFGARKSFALFPGLEYLEGDEPSSSTRDLAPPLHDRRVPAAHKVTTPLMAVQGDDALVALLWDAQQEWAPGLRRPAARFEAPACDAGMEYSHMSLFAPSVGDYVRENHCEAVDSPFPIKKGQRLHLEAWLVLDHRARYGADSIVHGPHSGGLVLQAMQQWFELFGLPGPGTPPRDWEEEKALCREAYFKSVWHEDPAGWSHCQGWPSGPSVGHAVPLMLDLASGVAPSVAPEIERRIDSVARRALDELGPRQLWTPSGCHILCGEFPFLYGYLAESLKGFKDSARAHLGARKDGMWVWEAAGEKHRSLGTPGGHTLGQAAGPALHALRAARLTGDPELAAQALDAMKQMERYEVPRGAQMWECPLYQPDILAAGQAVRAYCEAYRLTGEPAHLAHARYWAWTGLPFVYMWEIEGIPTMSHNVIAVFGSTFYTHSWLGLPVVWCGLVYAYGLQDLAEFDDSFPWKTVAEGILMSAMRQQYTNGPSKGCYPDSWNMVRNGPNPADINPENILVNGFRLRGQSPEIRSVRFEGPGGLPVFLNSPAVIVRSDAGLQDGRLDFTLRDMYAPATHTYLAPVAEPRSVTGAGERVSSSEAMLAAESAWLYDAELQGLILKHSMKGAEVACEILW